MKNKTNIKKKTKFKKLGISLVVTLAMLLLSFAYFDTMDIGFVSKKLGLPLLRLLFFIIIGLIVGQVIEVLGWTREVAVVARPFFRFSRLGNHCSAAFTTAFLSGAAANAMLVDFYEEKKISKVQLFLANYLNHFPAFFLHLPTTMFIVLPLTGVAGAFYFLLTFLATLVRTILFLLFGHFYLKQGKQNKMSSNHGAVQTKIEKGRNEKPSTQGLIKGILNKLPLRIVNILIWVLPIYTLVFILNINGVFDALNHALSAHVTLQVMPVESLSVVILSFAAEFTSGFAAAGALLDAGVLTVKQTVLALLLGNVLAFPIRALRHQLPRYMGIFAPKMGLQLLLSGQLFRIFSLLGVGLIYYWVA